VLGENIRFVQRGKRGGGNAVLNRNVFKSVWHGTCFTDGNTEEELVEPRTSILVKGDILCWEKS